MARANLNPVHPCEWCKNPTQRPRFCSKKCATDKANSQRSGYVRPHGVRFDVITPVPESVLQTFRSWRDEQAWRAKHPAERPTVAERDTVVFEDGWEELPPYRERERLPSRGISTCHCGRKDCRVHREEKRGE